MSNFNYPVNWPPAGPERLENFPYQNFFQANPLSDQVAVEPRVSGWVQPRLIISQDNKVSNKQWVSTYQIPCGTILPKSAYYEKTRGIIQSP
jgi:hypothetical protein